MIYKLCDWSRGQRRSKDPKYYFTAMVGPLNDFQRPSHFMVTALVHVPGSPRMFMANTEEWFGHRNLSTKSEHRNLGQVQLSN